MAHPTFLLAIASVATAASLTVPTAAFAQSNPFAPPAPGICVFNRDAAIGASAAGRGATVRMQQLQSDLAAELAPEQQAISRESEALKAARPSLTPAQFQQRAASLDVRTDAFRRRDQVRGGQLMRTKALAEQQIAQRIAALVDPIIAERRCAVLLDARAAYGFNPSMDITAQVVQALDRALPAISVNLVQ